MKNIVANSVKDLNLENNTLTYNAEYRVEYDMHVNERNRYYEYAGVPTTNQTLRGIYAKRDLYSIANTGFATFIYDISGAPLNNQGFFGTTTGNFALINQPLINCCINFIGAKSSTTMALMNIPKSVSESYLKISPNPNNGGYLTLQFQFKTKGNAGMSIVDILGRQVYNSTLFTPTTTLKLNTTIDLKKLNLTNGLYFVRLVKGKEILNSTLIIAK